MLNAYSEQGMCGYEQFKEAVPELRSAIVNNGKIRIRISKADFQ